MKQRNRARSRRAFSPLNKAPGASPRRKKAKRRAWTFERLEDRHFLSATPFGLDNLQTEWLSSDTAEDALAIWLRDLEWAARQTSNSSGDPTYASYAPKALPNDPLFPFQWHLLNTGQEVGTPNFEALFGVAGEDINVVPVWNMGYTGEGVLVAVIDTGVQMIHPDLVGNLHPTLRFNALSGTGNANPAVFNPDNAHGTAVAGLIGAVWNNLGPQLVDAQGNLVFDLDGNPIFSGGGSGVAPGVDLVPIRVPLGGEFTTPIFADPFLEAFLYAIRNDIDITNNSWGPADERAAVPISPFMVSTLRDSVIFGRDGLGMIHVFAAGNDAGPQFSAGFEGFGNYASASYNPWVNSRYTIGVTGVDHDGLYANADGTFTAYPTTSASVLVAAPTGSNVAQNTADDFGKGSGIWTTDLTGDLGYNAAPLPNGFDFDFDPLRDPDYTQRFNGTSAAAPLVSGVIALMLEANPNLTYRDVQEILVRSARQNAQFETPSSGALAGAQNTWQVNQIGPFRDPDPWPLMFVPPIVENAAQAILNPLADPDLGFLFFGESFAADTNDGARQFLSIYESQPPMFTNGAGYTVSQGYGVYAEQIGYAHGVIDAELAVLMAEQWHVLGQNIDPGTEKTFTTFVVNPGPGTVWTFPAAEKMDEMTLALIVPGGFGGIGGFIDYWNEFFEEVDFDDETGLPDPESGPFSGDDPPANTRGLSYIDFAVPAHQAINVEWVEVKIDITGPAEDLDFLRIMLTSPSGSQSELNHYYADPALLPAAFQFQPVSAPAGAIDPVGDIDVDGGSFVWTFSTNRHWGESTNSAVIIDPVTGEPVLANGEPIFRNWELHLENWSDSDYGIAAVEMVFHGKPIAGGTTDANWGVPASQRVQGFVGIDTNHDKEFNFNRYVQTVLDSDGDPDTIRLLDVTRQLDYNDNNLNGRFDEGDTINQEPFAENILVEAYRVVNGVVENVPTARFLTGDDGNYYFDLDPRFEYEIRITDPLGREKLEDTATPASAPFGTEYLAHYKQSWRITPDWFYAPDRDNPLLQQNDPGEILFGMYDANGDGIATMAPKPFQGPLENLAPIPMAVKNINFLLKQDAPPDQIVVSGTVIADINSNGAFDGDDTPVGGIQIYWDVNRNGVHDGGEPIVITSDDPLDRGTYEMMIPADAAGTFQLGIIPPGVSWNPTNPVSGVKSVFARPGDEIENFDFFIKPPNDAFPPAGSTDPGNIFGVVYNDRNGNGLRNPGDEGVAGFRVFIDANENGVWDDGEQYTFTSSNGSFHLELVSPGLIRIDVEEGDSWQLTAPSLGYREVELGPGGSVTGVLFGLKNLADRDWGSLPASYGTLAADNGPSHLVVPGFQLGATVYGSLDGEPTPSAFVPDNDGVRVVSNNGVIRAGANTLEVKVLGHGGYLNAWMDFNGDGNFVGDLGEHVLIDLHLNQGTHLVTVNVPESAAGGALAARFRWGEAGLSFVGPGGHGEVEDYFFASETSGQVVFAPGDFNQDGVVNQEDYDAWKSNFGATDMPNYGGVVDAAAYTIWRDNMSYGNTGSGSSEASTAAASAIESASVPPRIEPAAEVLDVGHQVTAHVEPLAVPPANVPVVPALTTHADTAGLAQQTLVVQLPTSADGAGVAGVVAPIAAGPTVDAAGELEVRVQAAAPVGPIVIVSAESFTTRLDGARLLQAPLVRRADARALDLVLADLAAARDREADELPRIVRRGDDDQVMRESALAEVFDEGTDWRLVG